MNLSNRIYFVLLQIIFTWCLFAQTNEHKLFNSSEGKYISYTAQTSLCDAVDYFQYLFKKYENINLQIESNCDFPIGVELNRVFYKNALEKICVQNNLFLRKVNNNIIITKAKNDLLSTEEIKRQVKISAILFEANLDRMKEVGVDWDYVVAKSGLEGKGGFKSLNGEDGNFGIRVAGDFGKFAGYTSAMFKFLESENLGKIVSKMTVVTNDEEKSKMQVGSDISIKQFDFAGNVTDAFFPTGTIINVEPKVIKSDSNEFVKLKIHVERSIPLPDYENKEIKRTFTNTEVLLKNNEDMIIGSLLVDEDFVLRKGIPVLKDLPWWVLGLRYLTGYDSKIVVHKEIVILVNAEILPSILERANDNIKTHLEKDSKELQRLMNDNADKK